MTSCFTLFKCILALFNFHNDTLSSFIWFKTSNKLLFCTFKWYYFATGSFGVLMSFAKKPQMRLNNDS